MSSTRPTRAQQAHSDLRWRIIELIASPERSVDWDDSGRYEYRVRKILAKGGGLNGVAAPFKDGTLIKPTHDLIVSLREEVSCLDLDDQFGDEEVELLRDGLEQAGARTLMYNTTDFSRIRPYVRADLMAKLGRTRVRHQALWIIWPSRRMRKRWLRKIRSTWGSQVIRDRGGQRVPGSCKVLRYMRNKALVVERDGQTRKFWKRNDKTVRDVMLARNSDPVWLESVLRFFEQIVPFDDDKKDDDEPSVKVVIKKSQTLKKITSNTVKKVLGMVATPRELSDNLRSPMVFFTFGTMRNAGLGVEDAVRAWKAGAPALAEFTSERQLRKDWGVCEKKPFLYRKQDRLDRAFFSSLEVCLERLPLITKSEIASRLMIVLHHVQRVASKIAIGHHQLAELSGCCPKTVTNLMTTFEEHGLVAKTGAVIKPGMGRTPQSWMLIQQELHNERVVTHKVEQPPLESLSGDRGREILDAFLCCEQMKTDPWSKDGDQAVLDVMMSCQSKVIFVKAVNENVLQEAQRVRSDRRDARLRAQASYADWLRDRPVRTALWRQEQERVQQERRVVVRRILQGELAA